MKKIFQKNTAVITVIIGFIILLAMSLGLYFILNKKTSHTDDTLTRSTVSIENVSEQTDFYILDTSYPNDPLDYDNEIATWAEDIITKTRNDWKVGGETWQAEQDLAKEFSDRPAMQYNMYIDYARYNSSKLGTVSYVMQNYDFTGGAHGNTAIKTFTFNESGSVNIADVLTLDETTTAKLTSLIKTKLMADIGDYTDADMLRDGLDCTFYKDSAEQLCNSSAVMDNLQNFYITDEGVTFVFGQYQIAAYVAGMPEVTFTWSELAPFMNPTFDLPLD